MTARPTLVERYESHALSKPQWYMDAEELNEVIEYYEDHNKHSEAECCLRHALALHPDNEALLVKEAYILRSKGHISEAQHIIDRLDENLTDVLFFKGEEALARLNIKEAKLYFDKIITTDNHDNTDCRLRVEIAECYLNEGFIDEASHILSEIPPHTQESKRAHILMAEAYFNRHDIASSLKEMDMAIDDDPYDVNSWSMLAEIHYESKHTAECQDACQYALAIDAKNEKALRISFFAYYAVHNHTKALETAQQYVSHWPDEYYIPMNAGELCMHEGMMMEALDYLGRANRNCPADHQDHLRIITLVAGIKAQQFYFEVSFEVLKCACAYVSQYSMVCVQMASLAMELNNIPFASDCLNQIIGEIVPSNGELCAAVRELFNNYQMLYLACPDVAKALRQINTSIS